MSRSNEVILWMCNKGYFANRDGQIYSPKSREVGYYNSQNRLIVCIRMNGRKRKVSGSRFIAYYFYGNKLFNNDALVLHINDNPKDNRISNLKIGDAKENALDKKKNGGNFKRFCYDHNIIFEQYKDLGFKETMNQSGISPRHLFRIISKHKNDSTVTR